VIRNGITTTISSEDLVVGDIVIVESGKSVPADCCLISSTDLSVNESALTGETETLHKSHVTPENYSHNPVPFLLQSSLVDGGDGKAIVCAVGEHTTAGQADRALDIQNEMTPL
jgi:Ca2+-transporting ATPase